MTLPALMADWAGRDADSLLWLASYPRSGNTFTRILLANYFAADEEAYDLNKLQDFIPSDTNKDLWEGADIGPLGSNTIEAVWRARPSVIAQHRQKMGWHALPGLKTHSAHLQAFDRIGFDFKPNDRALYIVRHPLDLLLSLADYNALDIDPAITMMIRSGHALWTPKNESLEIWGSWTEHVASWIDTPPCPVLLVRYEDLRSATESTLRSILTYLNVPIIEERLRQAIAASSFQKLREQEEARSFIEAPAKTNSGRFFREGKSLQWLKKLPPAQAHRLADACETAMMRLGYTHPRDVMVDGSNAIAPMQLPV